MSGGGDFYLIRVGSRFVALCDSSHIFRVFSADLGVTSQSLTLKELLFSSYFREGNFSLAIVKK